jgi:hypothetical protein
MANISPNPRMLTSKKEIQIYLGNISDHMFRKYIKAGLPARYEDSGPTGRWSASTKNIDEWWDIYTRVNFAKYIDQIADNGD